MSAMQAGTQMVKLRGSSKGLVRFYFLDEHRSCIRWRPSRKNEKAKSERGSRGGTTGGASQGQQHPEPWAWHVGPVALGFCGDLWTPGGEG